MELFQQFALRLKRETELIIEELENKIKSELLEIMNTHKESLNKLREEKEAKKEAFDKYKEKIKTKITELEALSLV